jgi:hypothetical protein
MTSATFAQSYLAMFLITSSIMDMVVKSNPEKFSEGTDFMRLSFKLFCGLVWPVVWVLVIYFSLFYDEVEE